MDSIKHVFVLMLENRSFDHLLGLSGLHELPPPPPDSPFTGGAPDRAPDDPPHEFGAVQSQINDGRMDGFSATGLKGFDRGALPVLEELAANYLLFDNWYSSMPGPTWPNRFFVHAASSGGLTDSPRPLDVAQATHLPRMAFKFENGSIFQRLEGAGRSWRVYYGDVTPQVLAVEGMTSRIFDVARFRPTYPTDHSAGDLESDLAQGDAYGIDYTFIEPHYGLDVTGGFFGDSQHPRDSVAAGEGLVKYVYETLRASPLWESSLLLITWDEHGGFYDRMPPGAARPPGDAPVNFPRGNGNQNPPPSFDFSSLGVRVPAILVSPWAPRGLASRLVDREARFDHASVVRSVREHFGLTSPLTARDATTPSWLPLLLGTMRTDADCPARLPAPAVPALATPAAAACDDAFVAGTTLIAYDLDQLVSRRTGEPALSASAAHQEALAAAAASRASGAAAPAGSTPLLDYIRAVAGRVSTHRQSLAAAPKRKS